MSDIGKKFDLTIVSTGIANAEHVKLAKSLDINIGSGKFYSKAVVKEAYIAEIKPKILILGAKGYRVESQNSLLKIHVLIL